MCGVAGFVGPLPAGARIPLLDSFNAAQSHRGPDGRGVWREDGAGLAHTRLAIIDLQTGDQPMLSADGRYAVVFNGEIYNYRALRSDLRTRGYEFKTTSDTEVIPSALDAWGMAEGLRRLRGMFALAVYDRRAKTLTLARDRFGIKPLYLARTAAAMLFASEMKALLDSHLIDRVADSAAIMDFLTVGATISPRTCWRSIEELTPGTWATFDQCLGRTGGCFAEPTKEPIDDRLVPELIDQVERVLLDSCERHLESDVPVGAFLSGGLDSSLLVAMLSRLRPGLDTFHVRFSESAYDESAFARRVSQHCGTRHHEVFLPPHEGTLELLSGILDQYDQPFGDSSAIPTHLISREISKHVKVAISGDGGDEVFGGYGRYATIRWLRMLHRVPLAGRALGLAGSLLGAVSPDLSRRMRKLGHMSALGPAGQMVAVHTYLGPREVEDLFEPSVARRLLERGPSELRIVPEEALRRPDPTEQLITFEVLSMLHGDYLRKVDIASSAHGLEVRTPILDAEVAEVGFRLPLRLRVGRGRFKRALRTVASRYLPDEVVQKPKWGFGVPFDRWLEPGEIAGIRDYLLGPSALSRDWLKRAPSELLLDQFECGGDRRDVSRYQVYQRVFMLIALESWLRRWRPSLLGSTA